MVASISSEEQALEAHKHFTNYPLPSRESSCLGWMRKRSVSSVCESGRDRKKREGERKKNKKKPRRTHKFMFEKWLSFVTKDNSKLPCAVTGYIREYSLCSNGASHWFPWGGPPQRLDLPQGRGKTKQWYSGRERKKVYWIERHDIWSGRFQYILIFL